LTDLFSEFPVLTDVAALGAGCFSHLSTVPVVVGVECLDAVQLHRGRSQVQHFTVRYVRVYGFSRVSCLIHSSFS
jgi:hypothetical protein